MNIADLMPDRWVEVSYMRYRRLKDRFMRENKLVRDMDDCIGCQCYRIRMDDEWIYRYCVFNKCIKQYPHRVDNEEFT